jgi:hypothetical protein
MAIKLPEHISSKNAGQLAAILETARNTPKHIPLLLKIESQSIIKDLSTHLNELT